MQNEENAETQDNTNTAELMQNEDNTVASPHPEPHSVSSLSTPLRQAQSRKRSITSASLTSTDKTIDAALNKLCKMADQDLFDNFGNLISSQLKSIPMKDALQLQSDISDMVNKRLLLIYQAKSSSVSVQSSRPSTSFTNYTSEATQSPEDTLHSFEPPSPPCLDLDEAQRISDNFYSFEPDKDLLAVAVQGLL